MYFVVNLGFNYPCFPWFCRRHLRIFDPKGAIYLVCIFCRFNCWTLACWALMFTLCIAQLFSWFRQIKRGEFSLDVDLGFQFVGYLDLWIWSLSLVCCPWMCSLCIIISLTVAVISPQYILELEYCYILQYILD